MLLPLLAGCIGLSDMATLADSGDPTWTGSTTGATTSSTTTTSGNTWTRTSTGTSTGTQTLIGDLSITAVDPPWGSNAGGQDVTVLGGPFDTSAQVELGGVAALVVGVAPDQLTVRLPATAAEGIVDVSVTTDDASGTLTNAFYFFPDGTGKAGMVGSFEWYEYLGGYWTGSTTGFGYAWAMLVEPIDVHLWDFYAPTDNGCVSEYSPSLKIYYYDLGLGEIEFTTGGRSVPLTWDAAGGAWERDTTAMTSGTSGDWRAGATYDLVPAIATGFPTLETSNAFTTPAQFNVTGPQTSSSNSITGNTAPTFRQSELQMSWSTSGAADRMVLVLDRYAADQTTLLETVTCVAPYSAGSITVPSSVWNGWAANNVVFVLFGAVREGTGTFSWDGSQSRVAGVSWRLGAFFAR